MGTTQVERNTLASTIRQIAGSVGGIVEGQDGHTSGRFFVSRHSPKAYMCSIARDLQIVDLWDQFVSEYLETSDCLPDWWSRSYFEGHSSIAQRATDERVQWLKDFADWLEAQNA